MTVLTVSTDVEQHPLDVMHDIWRETLYDCQNSPTVKWHVETTPYVFFTIVL